MNLELLFELSLYGVIGIGVALVVGASLYDVRLAARCRHSNGGRSLHVTVLVYAHTNAATISACLDSIVIGRLGRFDVVVADAMSNDGTRQVVRQYQRAHPLAPLRLYSMRMATSRQVALRRAYHRSQRGDVVLVVDADMMVDQRAWQSMTQFSNDMTLQGLWLMSTRRHTSQLSSVAHYFIDQSYLQYAKLRSLVRPTVILFGQTGCAYRVCGRAGRRVVPCQVMARLAQGKAEVVSGGSVYGQTPTARLRDGMTVFVLVWSLMLGVWAAQLAATLQTGRPLEVVWLAVSAWLAVMIMSDERTRSIDKIGYLFCVPVFGLITYVYGVVHYGAPALYRLLRRLR